MSRIEKFPLGLLTCFLLLASGPLGGCDADSSQEDASSGEDSGSGSSGASELHPAFAEFDADNTDISLDGNEVIIETNGLPNHTSPYWSPDHPLYVDATVATGLAPGFIDDFQGSYSLTVSASPQLAASSSATGLGAIGISVSGSVIYNDEEGPNVPLDNAASSLDYSGAHTGPQSYHYHLEPTAWSMDDSELIGIIADGFFLYGRRCVGDQYPTDLDESGGHDASSPHNDAGEYHYHIQNETYLGVYYILFPGDYQGTPNNVAAN